MLYTVEHTAFSHGDRPTAVSNAGHRVSEVNGVLPLIKAESNKTVTKWTATEGTEHEARRAEPSRKGLGRDSRCSTASKGLGENGSAV